MCFWQIFAAQKTKAQLRQFNSYGICLFCFKIYTNWYRQVITAWFNTYTDHGDRQQHEPVVLSQSMFPGNLKIHFNFILYLTALYLICISKFFSLKSRPRLEDTNKSICKQNILSTFASKKTFWQQKQLLPVISNALIVILKCMPIITTQ